MAGRVLTGLGSKAARQILERKALINGQAVKVFAVDQGLDLHDILHGHPEVLCALASWTGANMEALAGASYRLTDFGHYVHKGLVLPAGQSRRQKPVDAQHGCARIQSGPACSRSLA